MARSLNGSNQYLANTSFATGSFPITLSAWIYTGNASHLGRIVVWLNASGEVIASLTLNLTGSTPSLWSQVYNTAGLNSFASINGIVANTWHHCATVVTSTGHTPYLDGVAGTTVTYSTPTMLNMTRLHVGNYPGTQYFNGRISEVGAYLGDLSADIAGLAKGFTPLHIRPSLLTAYYPLGGLYGQLDLDRWKNRYDLTPSGSPTWADHPRVFYPRRSFWFPSPIVASTTVYTLEASPATVDVIGQSASLSAVRKLAAQPATIEVVGQEATLRVIRKIVASPATVDVVGQSATLSAVRRLAASPATIEVVGQAATLRVVRKIVASPATVDVVGQSATLTRARTLTANAAEVQVSGQAAGLTATRKITASPAAIEVVGQSANLRVVRRIVASPATVEVSGQTAVTRRTALLQGLAATIAVVGQAATLTYSGEAAVVTEDWIGVDKATGRTPKATATHRVGTATAIGRVSKATAYQRPQ